MSSSSSPSAARRRFLKQCALVGLASTLPANASSWLQPNPSRACRQRPSPLTPAHFPRCPRLIRPPAGLASNSASAPAQRSSRRKPGRRRPNSGWLGGAGESWSAALTTSTAAPSRISSMTRISNQSAKVRRVAPHAPGPQWHDRPSTNDDWWPRMSCSGLTNIKRQTGDPRVIPLMDRYYRHQCRAAQPSPPRLGQFAGRTPPSASYGSITAPARRISSISPVSSTSRATLVAQYATSSSPALTAADLKARPRQRLKDFASPRTASTTARPSRRPRLVPGLGSPSDRAAVLKMIAELDQYHGLPNGMFSCDEHLAGTDPTAAPSSAPSLNTCSRSSVPSPSWATRPRRPPRAPRLQTPCRHPH